MTGASQKPRSIGLWVGAALFLLLSYPLSLGPIIWLDGHELLPDDGLVENALRAVYTPLISATEEAEGSKLYDCYLWYLELWIG